MTPAALQRSIEEQILEFASLYNEVSTSDLQGMAAPLAAKLIAECQAPAREALRQCYSDLQRYAPNSAGSIAARAVLNPQEQTCK